MAKNENLPASLVAFSEGANPRHDWTVAFVLLSFYTAVIYCVNKYRGGRF